MNNTYLTWKFHIPAIIVGALCYLLLGIQFFSIIACLYLFISWLFRKEYLVEIDKNGLISPFTGKVKKLYESEHVLVPKEFQAVEYAYGLFYGFGIFFPASFETYDIVKNDNEVFLNLRANDETMVINFKKNIFGFLPKLWVFPGDKGKRGAKMGFFPMGGKVVVYISRKYKLTCQINTVLQGGITSFAINQKEE